MVRDKYSPMGKVVAIKFLRGLNARPTIDEENSYVRLTVKGKYSSMAEMASMKTSSGMTTFTYGMDQLRSI